MKTFICPKCQKMMAKAKGPWAIWYCVPCNYEWDVYNPIGAEPEAVEVKSRDLYDVWTGEWSREEAVE